MEIENKISKIRELLNIELTDVECDMVDKWYAAHPSCTHGAYLSMIESIKSMDMNEVIERKKKFFNSLPSKVFVSRKTYSLTYYVFDQCNFEYTNYSGWNCLTVNFDIVGEKITAYRTGRLWVTMSNCSDFENMKESSIDEIIEMSAKISDGVKNLFAGKN